MQNTSDAIAILGSGPVGCVLALALARNAPDPARIVLMGPDPAPRGQGETVDPRALALNQGSRQLLESLGAWPRRCADILRVHVSQAGHLGRTLIEHTELQAPRLGAVVGYDDLLEGLHQALANSGITRVAERPTRPQPGRPVALHDRRTAQVAVLSDGARPEGISRGYRQTAVLAAVHVDRPSPGLAFERFTRSGPLALLPHPDGPQTYNLVWCVPPDRAEALRDLSEPAFNAALQAAFGARLGTLQLASPRHALPLSMHAGPGVVGTGMVAIGNAAQTLHPVAGQGLNLGLRDAAQLAHTLAPWLACPDRDPQPLLEHYARRRRADRGLTLAITDSLPRVFATENPLIRHACGLGLTALDLIPGLRRPLARHLLQGQRL